MSAEEVAKAFVQHYYTTFDSNRAGLANLYVRLRSVCAPSRRNPPANSRASPVANLVTTHSKACRP